MTQLSGEHINTEHQLILDALQAFVKNGPDGKINLSNKRNIDFDHLYNAAASHQVSSIVHAVFKNADHAEILPENFTQRLDAQFLTAAFLATKKTAELKKATQFLAEKGLMAVPWRGPVLANHLYGNIFLRNFGDLDFIIQKKDFPALKSALMAHGYERYYEAKDEAQSFADDHALAFKKTEQGITFELDMHWSMAEKKWEIEYPDEAVWNRLQRQAIAGMDLPALHPEDLLLCLCIHHGTRNNWGKLKYLCDLSLWLKKHPDADWKNVLKKAKNIGVKNAMLTGFHLSHILLKTPLPSEIKHSIATNPMVSLAGKIIVQHIFETKKTLRSTKKNRHLSAQNIFLSLFFRLSKKRISKPFAPNELDHEIIKLPNRLHFLYYFLRPFRLVKKYGKRLT